MLRTMKSVVFFILAISVLNHKTTESAEEIEPIELRIKHLKRQIFEEINGLGNKPPYESDHYKELYDYVDHLNKPIVPISENDERKLHDRYKQPELKTTATTATKKYVASTVKTVEKGGQLRTKKQVKKKKNIEIFYRRLAFNPNERDRPQKWTHCLDLLSPFLNGFLSNITETKKVYATDPTVKRLRHLLTLNMTDASTEEIRSTLYEISNLQLRIFQWDTEAIKAILNILIESRPHDFKGLKYGIKNLFSTWKLNTSNLTRVLTQSRIFRPPCVQITNYAGSTVTPTVIRYTKPKREKQNTRNDEDDC